MYLNIGIVDTCICKWYRTDTDTLPTKVLNFMVLFYCRFDTTLKIILFKLFPSFLVVEFHYPTQMARAVLKSSNVHVYINTETLLNRYWYI